MGIWWLWVHRNMMSCLGQLESTASITVWSLTNVTGVPQKLQRLLGSLVAPPGAATRDQVRQWW